MNQALWVAKTGLDAQQTRLSVISNNLANVSTTGYKLSQYPDDIEHLMPRNVALPGKTKS